MTEVVNPYDHLPDYLVKSQIRKLSKHLLKNAMKGQSLENFEQKRILLLTLADSLERRNEVAWLERIGAQNLTEFESSS